MTPRQWRFCPHCDQRVPLTNDGRALTFHWSNKLRCAGSGEFVREPSVDLIRRNPKGNP
jgi:hypothetical protein